MNRKDLLKQAKASLDALVANKRQAQTDDADDTEATKLALLLESNDEIINAIREQSFPVEAFAESVRNAIKEIDIKVPPIEVPQATVNVPEIKMPEFPAYPAWPEIKLPTIHVPEPKVTVNVPEIKLPTINIPETVINFPDSMDVGLSKFTLKHPMPVIQVDPAGNFIAPTAGGGGGPRRVKIDNNASEPIPISGTISATFSADFGSGEIGSQTLRTVQATNAISSVYVTGANGTIGVVTINPDGNPVYGGSGSSSSVSVTDIFGTTGTGFYNGDNRLRVSLETGGSSLTDAELRATAVPVSQVSGANWSVSVSDVYGTTATNLINPDGRMKVELPTGSSGLTDTELRASHLDVQQVSGAIDSVNVISTVGLTDTQLRATSVPVEQVSGSTWSTSVIGTVPVSVANTLDVQQVSGASWSTNVLTMPAVVVTSVTNSIAVSLLGGGGTTLDPRDRNWTITETVPISSANTLDVKQVSGASDSVSVLTMPAIVVTSITNSTAASLVDSSGVQYSGSNPVPVKELRASTGTNSSVADNSASVTILASNTARLGATVYNDSTATLFLLLGSTSASSTNYSCRVASMGYYEVPFGYTGQLTGIWATDPGDGAARVTEIT